MQNARWGLAAAVVMLLACAHQPLSGAVLDRVERPAFISRIEDGAGPKAQVFREDNAYRMKLKKLDPKEADRRLQVKLQRGLSRFELSDRLRATTLGHLHDEQPWRNTVDPAQVAGVLESFLVEEVPANPPDYPLLGQLGADAVVEFVVEEFGMRSRGGRAGAFLRGYARMFFLRGGGDVWRLPFDEDDLRGTATAHLDPFSVGKEPDRFRQRMIQVIDRLAARFGKELDPPGRRGGRLPKPGAEELSAPPDDTNRTGKDAPPPEPELPPGELPDP